MNTTISNFLSKHNFVSHEDVSVIAKSILSDMGRGVDGDPADEDMIKTYMLPPKEKVTNESVIVIDAGGTNFRSCLVTFDAAGEAAISDMEKTRMPGIERELTKKEFFEQLGKNLEHLKNKASRIGFCFSYPMKITSDGDGVLIGFSKEVKAPEVVGSKIGECLSEELKKNGWNDLKRVTLLNDTVAALLAGHAIAAPGKDYSSFVGLILGTGLNAAYIQPKTDKVAEQIIVCESGKNMGVTRSDFDIDFDKTTTKPGTFAMEKTSSGAYLGPVALRVIQGAAKEDIFSPAVKDRLLSLESLNLIEIDGYLHAPKGDKSPLSLIMKECGTDSDRDNLFQLIDALFERSARRAAAILAAAVLKSGKGTLSYQPVCILCDGTTFHKTYKIRSRVEGYLESVLTKDNNLYWEITACDNDITLGTAIAGCVNTI